MELQNNADVEEEQAALDDHDEKVTDLTDRLQQLESEPKEGHSPSAIADLSKPLHTQLGRIEKRIGMVSEMMKSLSPGPEFDQCLLRQLDKEIVALKAELAVTGRGITLLETGGQEILDAEAALSKALFDLGVHVKPPLNNHAAGKTSGVVSGVKLPKIEVPTFDGNILNGAS